MLDYFSLLAAIGFSGAALGVTLFLTWINSRSEQFMLIWAIAMGLFVIGISCFVFLQDNYNSGLHCASFAFLMAGTTLVYAGSRQFHRGRQSWNLTIVLGLAQVVTVVALFSAGYEAVGTIFANALTGLFMILAGFEFWSGRREAPLPMTINSWLFLLIGVSFFLCIIPLIRQGTLSLSTMPSNPAEDLNAVITIVSLTGIGAISLALNQTRAARRHQAASMTDPLTGLLNRRALFDLFAKGDIAPGTGLILLDLDHFKSVNDRFGHAAGDAVLEGFAEILSQQTAACDTVARIGGEEFCVVVPSTGLQPLMQLAEAIRNELEKEPLPTSAGNVKSTVSIGVTICAGAPESFETLLERADRALYGAKGDGRNRVRGSGPQIFAA